MALAWSSCAGYIPTMRYLSPSLIATGFSIGGLLIGTSFALAGCSSEEGAGGENAGLGSTTTSVGGATTTSTGSSLADVQAGGQSTGVASEDQGNTTTTTATGSQAAGGASGMNAMPDTTTTMGGVIANAVYDAIGVRLYTLPMTPDRIKAAIKESS